MPLQITTCHLWGIYMATIAGTVWIPLIWGIRPHCMEQEQPRIAVQRDFVWLAFVPSEMDRTEGQVSHYAHHSLSVVLLSTTPMWGWDRCRIFGLTNRSQAKKCIWNSAIRKQILGAQRICLIRFYSELDGQVSHFAHHSLSVDLLATTLMEGWDYFRIFGLDNRCRAKICV